MSLRDNDRANSHYIVPERSGEITFDSGLIAQVIDAVSRSNISQCNFSSNYREQIVTRIQAYYTRRGTKPVALTKHDPSELLKAMALVLPDFTVGVKAETPFYDLKRTRDSATVSGVNELSSGESQLLPACVPADDDPLSTGCS
jgi:hypothetical protein